MILKGSQRGGAEQLAAHLLNKDDNDHVIVQELRGFAADDLPGALAEAHAVSKGTRCKQFMFSLSINPPKEAEASISALVDAADRAEDQLGLKDQPRAILIHEKDGRQHAHVVWSRIDADEMKAVNLSFFKNRLNELSKELYLEHGWELPEGYKTNGWKNPLNFTLAEWQQAKRLDLDPREIKQVFREAWDRSDNLASFRSAMEEHGYFVAKGDRRGVVALDIGGNVFSVSRWSGVKARDVAEKLKGAEKLPGVEQTRTDVKKKVRKSLRNELSKDRAKQEREMQPLENRRLKMVQDHRLERAQLQERQELRWKEENRIRASRFRRGLGAVMDVLTGRWFEQRRQNEKEAYAGVKRDAAQREDLISAQLKDRQELQGEIDALKSRHRFERMRTVRQITNVLRETGGYENNHDRDERQRQRSRSSDLDYDL